MMQLQAMFSNVLLPVLAAAGMAMPNVSAH